MSLSKTMAIVPAADVLEELSTLQMENKALADKAEKLTLALSDANTEKLALEQSNSRLRATNAQLTSNARARLLNPEQFTQAGNTRLISDIAE